MNLRSWKAGHLSQRCSKAANHPLEANLRAFGLSPQWGPLRIPPPAMVTAGGSRLVHWPHTWCSGLPILRPLTCPAPASVLSIHLLSYWLCNLGKCPDLSGPQSPSQYNGDNNCLLRTQRRSPTQLLWGFSLALLTRRAWAGPDAQSGQIGEQPLEVEGGQWRVHVLRGLLQPGRDRGVKPEPEAGGRWGHEASSRGGDGQSP